MKIKRYIVIFSILLLIISSFNFSSLNTLDNADSSKILYVGGSDAGNYSNIQDAIDDSNDGYTIFVYNGTYFEILNINKKIKLIGENRKNTTIDGSKSEKNKAILNVNTENVEITDFTIQNARGIDGRAGMFIGGFFTRNNVFKNNIVKNCSYGVLFVNPVNNIVSDNSLYGCGIGPHLTIPTYYGNTFENNTVNGEPSFLYVNKKNLIIDGVKTDSIMLINCKNIEIKNLEMSNITVGIDISYSKKIKVINNVISNTGRGGIYVHHSKFCLFEGNSFIDDNWGIFFRKSNFNKILRNNFINISMPDWFDRSYFNYWNSNYWGKPIDGIKKIYGKSGILGKLDWYNFDFNPKNEPY